MPFSSWLRPAVVLLVIFFLWSDWSPAQSTGGDGTPGVKRALLIGINNYKAVPKLQGSINDIETMRQILLTRWGFSEQNIKMVKDEAATRAGMLAALEQLVQDTGPNDTVYFHYSGHGSQVEDLNGDEPDDHLDETLVPQDGRSGNIRDIVDDELDVIFSKMRAKNVLILLDSCHSGTATRSLDIRTRSIPQDLRIEIYKAAEAAAPKTRAIVPVVTSRYVVMAGAASHQEALDGPVDGRYQGFFSYALSKSLSTSSPQASPREVFFGVGRELQRIQTQFGRSSMPEPQLEAPPELLDKPILNISQMTPVATGMKRKIMALPENASLIVPESRTARLPWIQVRPKKNGEVTLVDGLSLNAVVGSTWAIYPSGETSFTPGHALAVATVIKVSGNDAVAGMRPASKKIPAGARAVPLMPAPPGKKIPTRILDIPQKQTKQFEGSIKRTLSDVELVGGETPARFLIDTKGNTVRLLSADGHQVIASFPLDGDQWSAGLAVIVSRSLNVLELLALDNAMSQMRVTAQVKIPRIINVVREELAPLHPALYRIRKPNDPRNEGNSLQLEVSVDVDSYITIVDVDSEGGVNILFPNNHQRQDFHSDGLFRANEKVLIPDSLQPGNRAGFYWDYGPPQGNETIKVFAHTDLQTAQAVRQHIGKLLTPSTQTRGGLETYDTSSTLEALRETLERGWIEVADTTPLPSYTSNQPDGTPAQTTETATMPTPPMPIIPATNPDLGGVSTPVPASGAIVADWTAALVTVAISD